VQREHDLVAAGERRLVRLGFDLHDGPLQEIVALAEELRTASAQISAVVPADFRQRVNGRFNDVHARLGALDESLREIAHSIRSTTAVTRPVADAVECELRALENATGIEVELEVEGNLNGLSDSQKIVLFRIVQEALSNVRKHSNAAKVSVRLRSRRTFVDLTVADDGCGFDPRKLGHDRLGLAGISERVRLLGGAVEIETHPGEGTSVRATLPQWRPSSPATATVYAATR
jgi:signal transduction histidine kinase